MSTRTTPGESFLEIHSEHFPAPIAQKLAAAFNAYHQKQISHMDLYDISEKTLSELSGQSAQLFEKTLGNYFDAERIAELQLSSQFYRGSDGLDPPPERPIDEILLSGGFPVDKCANFCKYGATEEDHQRGHCFAHALAMKVASYISTFPTPSPA